MLIGKVVDFNVHTICIKFDKFKNVYVDLIVEVKLTIFRVFQK